MKVLSHLDLGVVSMKPNYEEFLVNYIREEVQKEIDLKTQGNKATHSERVIYNSALETFNKVLDKVLDENKDGKAIDES